MPCCRFIQDAAAADADTPRDMLRERVSERETARHMIHERRC